MVIEKENTQLHTVCAKYYEVILWLSYPEAISLKFQLEPTVLTYLLGFIHQSVVTCMSVTKNPLGPHFSNSPFLVATYKVPNYIQLSGMQEEIRGLEQNIWNVVAHFFLIICLICFHRWKIAKFHDITSVIGHLRCGTAQLIWHNTWSFLTARLSQLEKEKSDFN